MATTSTTLKSAGPLPGSRTFLSRLTDGDEIARLTTMVFAATVVLLTTALVLELWVNSALPRHKFGFHFLFTQTWDPIMDDFGALIVYEANTKEEGAAVYLWNGGYVRGVAVYRHPIRDRSRDLSG